MDKKKYTEIRKGLFLKKNIEQNQVFSRFKNSKKIIFDFDGTILNGYSLGIIAFSTILKKIMQFKLFYFKHFFKGLKLFKRLKTMPIEESSIEFAKIIKGLDEKDFLNSQDKIFTKIFPFSIKFIKKLKSQKKEILIISLSDKKLISNIKKIFDVEINARELKTKNGKYVGNFKEPMTNSQHLKKKFATKFIKQEKYVYFGNDLDDALLIKNAHLSIGINPNDKIINKLNFDLISIDTDPWKNIYSFFGKI